MNQAIVWRRALRVQFGFPSSTPFGRGTGWISDHIAIMIIERLATKVAIEANAAMSRSRSVIVVSRVLLCFYFVLILFESQ